MAMNSMTDFLKLQRSPEQEKIMPSSIMPDRRPQISRNSGVATHYVCSSSHDNYIAISSLLMYRVFLVAMLPAFMMDFGGLD